VFQAGIRTSAKDVSQGPSLLVVKGRSTLHHLDPRRTEQNAELLSFLFETAGKAQREKALAEQALSLIPLWKI
jgi:hypothetical protein